MSSPWWLVELWIKVRFHKAQSLRMELLAGPPMVYSVAESLEEEESTSSLVVGGGGKDFVVEIFEIF